LQLSVNVTEIQGARFRVSSTRYHVLIQAGSRIEAGLQSYL